MRGLRARESSWSQMEQEQENKNDNENGNGTTRVGEQNGAQLMSLHTFCRLSTFYEYRIRY